MRLAALALICATTVAYAEPDLQPCFDQARATLSDKERAEIDRGAAKPPPDFGTRERAALADSFDPVGKADAVLDDELAAGEAQLAARLVDAMEHIPPPTYDNDKIKRELVLARAQAAIGHGNEARAHIEAVRPQIAKPGATFATTHHQLLLVIALTLKDEAFAKSEEALLRAAIDQEGHHGDASVEARFIAYAGFGRRALSLADRYPREHDLVLSMILEGVRSRNDLALTIEIVGKFTSARERILELHSTWNGLDRAARRSLAFVAAVRAARAVANRPVVDDFARGLLVDVLADLEFTRDAAEIARRIANPWDRARAEAVTAAALAVPDPAAGAALARAAWKRAATPGARKDVINDTSAAESARRAAISALTRAGATAEAEKLGTPDATDIAVGLRTKPKELATWWSAASPLDRYFVIEAARDGWLGVADVTFVADVCR